MSLPRSIKVDFSDGNAHGRVDVYLAKKFPDFSRAFFQKLLLSGLVEINGAPIRDKNTILKGGEIIFFRWSDDSEVDGFSHEAAASRESQEAQKQNNIPLDIIFEDEDIIVVNKQSGLVAHPACGHPDGTLTDALQNYSRGKWKPYLAHRLDKDTTGVIIAAKNERARDILASQFKSRSVRKIYIAIVKGVVNFKKAIIDAPLGRKATNRFLTVVGEGAKMRDSRTEAEKIFEGKGLSVMLVRPITGRTHQIRAHFAFIKHPILGDAMYGGGTSAVARPLLHAYSINLRHPSKSGKKVTYVAPVPEDMIQVVPALKKISIDLRNLL